MDGSLQDLMAERGAASLSTKELLAVLLRTGNGSLSAVELAQQCLTQAGSLHGLARLTYSDLVQMLNPQRAAQVAAALELARRIQQQTEEERPIIRNAEDAARLVAGEMSMLRQEHFRTMLLDVRRRIIAVPTIYIGSLHMTVVRAAEVFREAITRNCASVILIHNHPSGDPTPSPEDLTITEDLIAAGRVLDIAVLDHVIIGQGKWVSLRDTGVKF